MTGDQWFDLWLAILQLVGTITAVYLGAWLALRHANRRDIARRRDESLMSMVQSVEETGRHIESIARAFVMLEGPSQRRQIFISATDAGRTLGSSSHLFMAVRGPIWVDYQFLFNQLDQTNRALLFSSDEGLEPHITRITELISWLGIFAGSLKDVLIGSDYMSLPDALAAIGESEDAPGPSGPAPAAST